MRWSKTSKAEIEENVTRIVIKGQGGSHEVVKSGVYKNRGSSRLDSKHSTGAEPHIDVLVDNTAGSALMSFMDGFSRYN